MSDNDLNISKTLIDKLYDKQVKIDYLMDKLEDDLTREKYCIYLIYMSEFERKIDKKIYEMSREELLDMFSDYYTGKHSTLRTYYSVCKQYLEYCTDMGHNKTAINMLDLIKFKQHVQPMLNIRAVNYITEEELWKIESKSRNYQDFATLVLPFYGVRGSKNIELVNLKETDVDGVNNNVTVLNKVDEITGEYFERTIELPQRVIEVVQKAANEDIYEREFNENNKVNNLELVDNEYVFRPIKSQRKDMVYDKPTSQIIFSRAKRLLVNAGYEDLSIADIFMSGKLHLLKQIEASKGELVIDDFKFVQERFGDDPKNYANLKETYAIISKTE